MTYFVNILYNLHIKFQNMQPIVVIKYLFTIIVYLSFILNMNTALNFVNNIFRICISDTDWFFLYSLACLFLLYTLLGMSSIFS